MRTLDWGNGLQAAQAARAGRDSGSPKPPRSFWFRMTAGGIALLQADRGFEKVSARYLPQSSDWIQNLLLDLPLNAKG